MPLIIQTPSVFSSPLFPIALRCHLSPDSVIVNRGCIWILHLTCSLICEMPCGATSLSSQHFKGRGTPSLGALGVTECETMRPRGGTSGNEEEAVMGFCIKDLSRGGEKKGGGE